LLAQLMVVDAQPLAQFDKLAQFLLERFQVRFHSAHYSFKNPVRSTANVDF
jgi:hypothetical protein